MKKPIPLAIDGIITNIEGRRYIFYYLLHIFCIIDNNITHINTSDCVMPVEYQGKYSPAPSVY